MLKKVGEMMFKLRETQGMTQEQVCRGLISVSEFSRLESGESEADRFLLEALLQRLGKSVDKFEMMLSEEEYKFMILRQMFTQSLLEQDYERAELVLEEYGGETARNNVLQQQYLLRSKALLFYLHEKDIVQCRELLRQAIAMTS